MKHWEEQWTENLTIGIITLFLVWMMFIAWRQPDPETLIEEPIVTTPSADIEEAPAP